MATSNKVAIYFVASPLQYLAARQIAEHFEKGARQVLIWYQPGVRQAVKEDEWDACSYMPWPRHKPLPGPFGRHRRLRENIRLVAGLVGQCDELVLHSAVYDTEAINYFLQALPRLCGARTMHARILPDGLISIRRYPLSPIKLVLQRLRKMRRIFAPELNYTCFSGDRIGSDASFCDRIYVMPGLPHEYPEKKVCPLPPLLQRVQGTTDGAGLGPRRALVVGQPLANTGLMSAEDVTVVTARIREWLRHADISEIDYKAHPKDPARDLWHPDYKLVEPNEALELYMAAVRYDAVIGVRSSALMFARFIYVDEARVLAAGWERIRFKSAVEKEDMKKAFTLCAVEFLGE